MGRKPDRLAWVAVVAAALAGTSACAGREARDFSGRWTPANQYAATTEAIPLAVTQVYQASPMDGTLHNLLTRWARDSGSELDYRHPSDFRLHQPVRGVRAHALADALAPAGPGFDAQGASCGWRGARLVVARGAPGR